MIVHPERASVVGVVRCPAAAAFFGCSITYNNTLFTCFVRNETDLIFSPSCRVVAFACAAHWRPDQ
jgi:hypothetical protein